MGCLPAVCGAQAIMLGAVSAIFCINNLLCDSVKLLNLQSKCKHNTSKIPLKSRRHEAEEILRQTLSTAKKEAY